MIKTGFAAADGVLTPSNPQTQPTKGGREVVVNRLAAEAVLKGADLFAPGLMAASPGIAAGDLVAVTVALEKKWGPLCGACCLRARACGQGGSRAIGGAGVCARPDEPRARLLGPGRKFPCAHAAG
jgi:hypothetical protein